MAQLAFGINPPRPWAAYPWCLGSLHNTLSTVGDQWVWRGAGVSERGSPRLICARRRPASKFLGRTRLGFATEPTETTDKWGRLCGRGLDHRSTVKAISTLPGIKLRRALGVRPENAGASRFVRPARGRTEVEDGRRIQKFVLKGIAPLPAK